MSNPIEDAHQALIARLGQIVPGNGYQTDAGTRVKEGWLEEILQEEGLAFPFIAVQPADSPPPLLGAGALQASIGRRVVGAVRPSHPEAYRAELDALYLDLAMALHVQEGQCNPWGRSGPYKVALGTSKLFPPGGGLAAGTLLFPVVLHIIINGA